MKADIVNDGSCTRVYIDGEEIHRVVSVEVKQTVGDCMSVVLELFPDEVEVHTPDALVKVVTLEDKKKEEGYRDFVRFLFRGKYGLKGEDDDTSRTY